MASFSQNVEMAKQIPLSEVFTRIESYLPPSKTKFIKKNYAGPCPICGGHDRFYIDFSLNIWSCRQCLDNKAGDSISLAGHVLGLDFKESVRFLMGEEDKSISKEEWGVRQKKWIEEKAKKEKEQARYAEWKRQKAHEIWRSATNDSEAFECLMCYFNKRGMGYIDSPVLRFSQNHPMKRVLARGQKPTQIYKGSCMIAAIQGMENKFMGVHQTWIDLNQENGKAKIIYEGEAFPAKSIFGSSKGCAIRLFTPKKRVKKLIVAEGIETTMAAMNAIKDFDDIQTTAFWCLISMNNISGSKLSERPSYPDLEDKDAFIPPKFLIDQGLEEYVVVMDGDSDPKTTRDCCEVGLRRAGHYYPHLKLSLAKSASGMDLNDMMKLERT